MRLATSTTGNLTDLTTDLVVANNNSAIIIQDNLKVEYIYERVQVTVEIITKVMPGVVVHCLYKLPV